MILPRLEADVAEWDHKPQFWCRRAVGWKKWWIAFGYDGQTAAGRIYGFVDSGTGFNAGKGPKYPIFPRNTGENLVLHFKVPTPVKSTPGISGIGPGLVLSSGIAAQADVFAKSVLHPGITPRDFTKSLRRELAQRNRPGGFRSTIDAAVKRALRKV